MGVGVDGNLYHRKFAVSSDCYCWKSGLHLTYFGVYRHCVNQVRAFTRTGTVCKLLAIEANGCESMHTLQQAGHCSFPLEDDEECSEVKELDTMFCPICLYSRAAAMDSANHAIGSSGSHGASSLKTIGVLYQQSAANSS